MYVMVRRTLTTEREDEQRKTHRRSVRLEVEKSRDTATDNRLLFIASTRTAKVLTATRSSGSS